MNELIIEIRLPPKKEHPSAKRWRTDPKNKAKIKAYAKDWYQKNKERVKLKWMQSK